MTERLHLHFSLSCIGEGNGNPLQCSYLENPRDGRAWWAAVSGSHRVRHDWSDLAAAAEVCWTWGQCYLVSGWAAIRYIDIQIIYLGRVWVTILNPLVYSMSRCYAAPIFVLHPFYFLEQRWESSLLQAAFLPSNWKTSNSVEICF